nr:TMV resistance protein N-like [Ipomoea batatas]
MHHDPHKISISLDPNWYSHNFVGFIVCFLFPKIEKWESHPNIRPFRHCELITKLTHKDNGNEPPLQTKCVIGRLYDEEFHNSDDNYDEEFHNSDDELVCFAYIPFSSLWPKSKAITDNATLNHYLIFEVAIMCSESKAITYSNWSCDLLYTDDESLTEAIRRKR